ncbi:MAG: helix-turn-helix transcriptional regulator [Gammaproteobacteria bacterium]|nr:helix-turn-helix transcriptional regulator [Gammaproteobacteria bacterium]
MSTIGTHEIAPGVGERLRAYRAAKGLTQQVIARQARVSRAYWAGVESGAKPPSGAFIMSLIGTLDVSVDWLLSGAGGMTRTTIPGATVRGAVREALAAPDPDLARLLVWLEEWWAHAAPRERTWLLVQWERCLPEYAAWLAEQQGSAGHYSHGSGGKS